LLGILKVLEVVENSRPFCQEKIVIELPAEILEPFAGYLALGMYLDANDELENLPTALKAHPTVLSARLELLIEMKRWEDGAILGQSLFKLWPDACEHYVRTAFCLHEMKQTKEARKTLLCGPEALRSQAVYFYNLACYEAQLGNIAEAKRQLAICFEMDKAYKAESLDDPDLAPLWELVE
jgi:predicted Zn-dependent protease